MKIVLASGSPRRKQLLEKLDLQFEIDPADFDERSIANKSAAELAQILAVEKAKSVATRHPDSIIIGSDTIVEYNNKQIGKPEDSTEAKQMLQMLRGNTNQVVTGMAVLNTATGRVEQSVDIANVTMRNYTDKEIDDYIATGEPMDKAGAYAIQGIGRALIEKFDGDLDAVIGLPTKRVLGMIEKSKLSSS